MLLTTKGSSPSATATSRSVGARTNRSHRFSDPGTGRASLMSFPGGTLRDRSLQVLAPALSASPHLEHFLVESLSQQAVRQEVRAQGTAERRGSTEPDARRPPVRDLGPDALGPEMTIPAAQQDTKIDAGGLSIGADFGIRTG